jgi:hypothetical protein
MPAVGRSDVNEVGELFAAARPNCPARRTGFVRGSCPSGGAPARNRRRLYGRHSAVNVPNDPAARASAAWGPASRWPSRRRRQTRTPFQLVESGAGAVPHAAKAAMNCVVFGRCNRRTERFESFPANAARLRTGLGAYRIFAGTREPPAAYSDRAPTR